MKTSQLTGADLDYWVARAGGLPLGAKIRGRPKPYSTDWSIGGPIIEREKICLEPSAGLWNAACNAHYGYGCGMEATPSYACADDAPTPLIAAMRAYVAGKFGEELPEIN